MQQGETLSVLKLLPSREHRTQTSLAMAATELAKSASSSYRNYYSSKNQKYDGKSQVNRRDGYDFLDYGYGYDHHSAPSPPHSSSFSSYGHGGKVECCPLVVKPLVLAAIVGLIGLATAFLSQVIAMTMFTPPAPGKKRKRDLGVPLAELGGFLLKGRAKKDSKLTNS